MNEFDVNLLLFFNFDGGRTVDTIMWLASGIPTWIPLYLLVLFMIYHRHGWKYMLFGLIFIALGVGICDQLANLFKSDMTPYLRPTRTPEVYPLLHTVRGYKSGMYGTVSGHASTSFCIFLMSSLMARRGWVTGLMLFYTVMASYSRMYLGVHFPFQILFGLILGASVGYGMWKLFSWLAGKYLWSSLPKWVERRRERRGILSQGKA